MKKSALICIIFSSPISVSARLETGRSQDQDRLGGEDRSRKATQRISPASNDQKRMGEFEWHVAICYPA